MVKKYNINILIIFFILIFSSCSKDNGTEFLIEGKLETMSEKEMLRELLIKNENEVEQLARIFQCSPSSLKRIVKGETLATDEAKKQFRNILNQTLTNKEKSLDNLDLKRDSWKYKVMHFFDKYYLWFIGVFVIGILSLIGEEDKDKNSSSCGGCFILFLVSCILLYLFLYFSYDEAPVVDNFKNTYDPIWEVLK